MKHTAGDDDEETSNENQCERRVLAQSVSTVENAFEAEIGREKVNKTDNSLRAVKNGMQMHQ
jgi:hypothetical protein